MYPVYQQGAFSKQCIISKPISFIYLWSKPYLTLLSVVTTNLESKKKIFRNSKKDTDSILNMNPNENIHINKKLKFNPNGRELRDLTNKKRT